jgi:hypothetical protein
MWRRLLALVWVSQAGPPNALTMCLLVTVMEACGIGLIEV